MSWNRPVESESRNSQKKSPAVRHLIIFVVLAAVTVIGLLGVIFWLPDDPDRGRFRQTTSKTKKDLLEVVRPAKAQTNAAVASTCSSTNGLPKLKPGEKRNVTWTKPPNWDQMTLAQRTRYQPVGRVIKPKWMGEKNLFKTLADKKINRLLQIRPGQMFIGTATYDKKFVQNFVESLKTPIEFADDDTEEDRAAKQAVIDTRNELKEAYDRGEDIAAIMRETEKSLHEQATYRINLQREIVKYKQSGEHSDQDVKDYIDAANTILKEHGMEPLKLKQFWYHKALIDAKEVNKQ